MSPKISNTRQQRAVELVRRLEEGPILYMGSSEQPFVRDEAAMRNVHIWLETWIVPDVIELVPELKRMVNESKNK